MRDLSRYQGAVGMRGFLRSYFIHAGFRVTFWFRVASSVRLKYSFLGKLCTIWLMRYHHQTGVHLIPGTQIGPGLYIPHFGAIVINPNSRIGSNCYLSHCVTLGKAHTGVRKGAPQLGDDVFLGPGVQVLGSLVIGDNAAIGANSVVLSDIPSGCFAVGSPAKVVKELGARELLGYVDERSGKEDGN